MSVESSLLEVYGLTNVCGQLREESDRRVVIFRGVGEPEEFVLRGDLSIHAKLFG